MHHAPPPRHRRSLLLPSWSGAHGFRQGTVESTRALLLHTFNDCIALRCRVFAIFVDRVRNCVFYVLGARLFEIIAQRWARFVSNVSLICDLVDFMIISLRSPARLSLSACGFL